MPKKKLLPPPSLKHTLRRTMHVLDKVEAVATIAKESLKCFSFTIETTLQEEP
jgi:hypothetical protein